MAQFFLDENIAKQKSLINTFPNKLYVPVNIGRTTSNTTQNTQALFTEERYNNNIELGSWVNTALSTGLIDLTALALSSITLVSPDGTNYQITVDNAGVLSTTAV